MTSYWAHFEGVDVDKLLAIEDKNGEMDDVTDYLKGLFVILALWRKEVIRLSERYPGRHSRPEVAEYNTAVHNLLNAHLQWSFRGSLGETDGMPDDFALPVPAEVRK